MGMRSCKSAVQAFQQQLWKLRDQEMDRNDGGDLTEARHDSLSGPTLHNDLENMLFALIYDLNKKEKKRKSFQALLAMSLSSWYQKPHGDF